MGIEVGEEGYHQETCKQKRAARESEARNIRQEIAGIVEIIKTYYLDPSDSTGKFGTVDIRAAEAWKRPVTLDAIKADPRLTKMTLVTNSRLSAQPVSAVEWEIIRAEGALL